MRRCKVVRLRRTFLNLLHDNLLIRLFIGEGNCRVIEGGWLDKRLIYSGSSFGFLYGLYVPLVKSNVMSMKFTFIRFACTVIFRT